MLFQRHGAHIGKPAVLTVVAVVAQHPDGPLGHCDGTKGLVHRAGMYASSIGEPLMYRVRLRISMTSPGIPITRLINLRRGSLGYEKTMISPRSGDRKRYVTLSTRRRSPSCRLGSIESPWTKKDWATNRMMKRARAMAMTKDSAYSRISDLTCAK